MKLIRGLVFAFSWLLVAAPAFADVWGFVDQRGVAHFASEKLDERYELFFKAGQSFDTSQGLVTPRSVPVPTAPTKLIAFFQVSPGFKQVQHHLREASRQHGIDYELLQALIATESGFDAQAVSPKGALGLMQIMPGTAQRYGVNGDAKMPLERKLFDPRTNIITGTRYLRDLMRMFDGRLDLVLAAYNAGEGAVQRAGNRIPNYRETQNYVKTVMQLYTVLKPPASLAASNPGVPSTGVRNAGVPNRVRMELPGPVPGGAIGRGNLPPAAPTGTAVMGAQQGE